MVLRAAALLLSATLVAGCGASGPASTAVATHSPDPGASPTAATTAGVWTRLAWEEVALPGIPRYRFLTNVNTSARGTLFRYVEKGDSPTAAVLVTRDGRTWTQASSPTADTPLGRPIEGGPDWLQVVEPLDDGAPLELLASSDGLRWDLRGRLPAELVKVGASAITGDTIVICGAASDAAVLTTCGVSNDRGVTWTRMPALDTLLETGKLLGLDATSTGFAAVVEQFKGRAIVATTATSVNGRSWTILPDALIPDISKEIAPNVAAFRDAMVIWGALMDGGEYIRGLWTSLDGTRWERVPLPRIVAWSGSLEIR